MNTFAKVALVTAVAVGTAGAGGFVASRMLGQNLFEKKLEHLAKNPNISYENLEKSFDTRKDKITVKSKDPYAVIKEYEFTIDTKFALDGFHSDFNINYDYESIKVLSDSVIIKNKPENRGYVDFSYPSENGTVHFENDPFKVALIDDSITCDIGKITSNIDFTNSQLSREASKIMDYMIKKADPIVQKSHVDSIKCTSDDFTMEMADFNVNIQQLVFTIPSISGWKIGKITGQMSDDSKLSVGSAEGQFSIINNGSGEDDNVFSIVASVSDFNLETPITENAKTATESAESVEAAAENTVNAEEKAPAASVDVAAENTVTAEEKTSVASVDKVSIAKADFRISLSDLKKSNLEDLLVNMNTDKLFENQSINLAVKSDVKTTDGDSVLDASLKTPDMDYLLQKHDLVINYSVSEKVAQRLFEQDPSIKEAVDGFVAQGYVTLKDGVYSSTVTSKDSFEIYANGKLVQMF